MQRHIAALSWNDVRVLLAIARTGNLAGAATRLEVDKATVSRRLVALERSVKQRLFLRTREGLTPSATALRLLPHAEAMERAADALQDATVPEEEITGAVKFACTEALAVRLVAAGLLEVSRKHPALALDVMAGNRPADLLRGEADLALRFSQPQQRSLRARVVARLGFALFASRAYLERRGTPPSLARLEGHDVLLPSGELATLPEARWLSSRPGVRVAFQSTSMPALVEAARGGHGLLVLTTAWGESEPGLEFVLALPSVTPRPVWLLSAPGALDRKPVRVVAERVAELMRSLA